MITRHFSYRYFLLDCRSIGHSASRLADHCKALLATLTYMALAVLLVATLGGCAGRLAGESYVRNPLPEQGVVIAIAQDAAAKLSTIYPPGHTRLELVHPANSNGQRVDDAFSAALEDGLRRRGFTVSPSASLRLAWTLDALPQAEEASADPLLAKKEKSAVSPSASRTTSQTASEEKMDWYLRLKLADTDKFQVRTLTRMYGADGQPMAGFAEQATGER